MMAVGFFGCCGAMRESQCVLGSVSGASGEGTGLKRAPRSGLQRQLLGPAETLALTPSSLSLRFSISCLRIILSLSLPHMESMKNMRSLA